MHTLDDNPRDFFEPKWKTVLEASSRHSVYEFENPLFADSLSNSTTIERVLDLGCGDGRLVLPLLAGGGVAECVDVSESALLALTVRKEACAASGQIIPRQDDIGHHLSRKGEHRYSLIIISSVLHYFSAGSLRSILGEVSSRLLPDGKLYIASETNISMKTHESKRFSFSRQYNHSDSLIEELLSETPLVVVHRHLGAPVLLEPSLPRQFAAKLKSAKSSYNRSFQLDEFICAVKK